MSDKVPVYKIEVRTSGDVVLFRMAQAFSARPEPDSEKIELLRTRAGILRADPEQVEGRGRLFEDIAGALERYLERIRVASGGHGVAEWRREEPLPPGEPS